MSTDNSQHSQFEEVPANSSASDNDDSSRAATYQNLVRDPELFWDTLRVFLETSGRTFKIPIVGGHSLDLHRLFNEVTSRGGLEKVIKDRKCKEVIEAFNFKNTVTNAAFVLRKYYLKMLFEFEHVYYFQAPLSSFWEKEKAVKLLVEKSANRDKGPQEVQPGFVVSGVIDGTFESGYFVTVKIGTEELKGVLYDIPQSPPKTKRRKKRSKSSRVNSQRPKFHRSGYNFFFAENYPRVNAEYAGQDRSVIKEIGKMWTNLSESDRKVYQEKGLEDLERYNMEMLQYRSSMDSSAAETVAATDAAASASASTSPSASAAETVCKCKCKCRDGH